MILSSVNMAFSLACSSSSEDTKKLSKSTTITKKWPTITTSKYNNVLDQVSFKRTRELDEFKDVLRINISGDHRQDRLADLNLVDAILRLGLEHHYEEEIEAVLQRENKIFNRDINGLNNQDLYEVALRFRLLRQGGYHVTSDAFKKFIDTNGKFNTALLEHKEGLMELFEASQLSVEDEHILEEAERFSRHHLTAWSDCLTDNIQARSNIQRTLEQPYHKTSSRLTATNLLKSCEGTNEEYWMTMLKEVARKNFNIAQSIHRKEIAEISKWWKELGLANELRFARDQPLKWYLGTVATLPDPSLSEQRIELTKPISLVYIIDDVFDLYGTLDELTLFTHVVNEWDIIVAEQLPHYLKICFEALNDITNEISQKVFKNCGWNPISSLRKSWAKLCNAFLVEAQWFGSGNLPDEEDYLKNAIVSSGAHVVLLHMFYLLGQDITQESVDILDNIPGIVSSSATILRLWDDLGNAKDENQDGHDGSYLECYMKKHEGCTIEEARMHVMGKIDTEWKRLNKEYLCSKHNFPLRFNKACLNGVKMVKLMYQYDDNQRLPGLENFMKTLFC